MFSINKQHDGIKPWEANAQPFSSWLLVLKARASLLLKQRARKALGQILVLLLALWVKGNASFLSFFPFIFMIHKDILKGLCSPSDCPLAVRRAFNSKLNPSLFPSHPLSVYLYPFSLFFCLSHIIYLSIFLQYSQSLYHLQCHQNHTSISQWLLVISE